MNKKAPSERAPRFLSLPAFLRFPMLEKYVYSFWWSVTTLVGKGLVFQPQTTIEQVCSIIT